MPAKQPGAPLPKGAASLSPLERIARALAIDAGELGASSVDPAAPPGDLKAELEAFTSLDGCVQQRARLDPVLGDALEAIGYDTFVRDACRVIDAAKARDAKRCDGIDVMALRSRCQATVAEIAANADECPWDIASRPAKGRDPACVAIASHDARLCVAALDPVARATCHAIAAHDAGACAKVPSLAARARCSRDSDRWRSAIPASDAATEPFEVAGKVSVAAKTDAGAILEGDMTPDLAGGVVLLEQRDGTRFVVGPLTGIGPGFIASSPHVDVSLALEVFAPLAKSPPSPERGRNVTLERAELLMLGRPPLATPAAHSTLKATLGKLGRARGDAVSLVVDGDLGDASFGWHMHAEVSTFVRDVVHASEMFEAPPPGLGHVVEMR